MKVLVAQSCPTPLDPMNSLPGSSVHGILQSRVLEWGSYAFFQGIFPTQGSNPHLLHWWILYHWTTRKASICQSLEVRRNLVHQRNSEKISSLKIFRESHVKLGQESRSKIMQELWLTDIFLKSCMQYIWNLEKWWTYLQGRNRETET